MVHIHHYFWDDSGKVYPCLCLKSPMDESLWSHTGKASILMSFPGGVLPFDNNTTPYSDETR